PGGRRRVHASRSARTRVVACDEFDRRVDAQHERGARLQQAPEAIADPPARVGRSFDEQASAAQLSRLQRLQPDAICGLLDAARASTWRAERRAPSAVPPARVGPVRAHLYLSAEAPAPGAS